MCIKIHVAKCVFSDTQIRYVGHTWPLVRGQQFATWRNVSGENHIFFVVGVVFMMSMLFIYNKSTVLIK
jgi:hypothetical protein